MTDFAQAFQNDHNISDAVETRSVHCYSQVILVQVKIFFHALGGSYSQNAFPSPIIRINPFSHESKTTSSERKMLLLIKEFVFEIWRFTRFSCDISKCASKQGDGNPAFVRYIYAINMLHPGLSSSAVT